MLVEKPDWFAAQAGVQPMTETLKLQADLAEARRVFGLGDLRSATAFYESLLGTQQLAVINSIRSVQDLSAHKKFLRHSLLRQMVAQGDLEKGFYINLGTYTFFGGPTPDIFISPKAIHAIEAYKGKCTSLAALRNDQSFKEIANHPQAPILIYYAHSVAADIVDLCLINRVKPAKRVADFGAGAGLQAVTLAVLNRNVTSLNLFEIQDFMQDSILDLFKTNGVDHFYLNKPIVQPVDCFYSFRACAYLFSIDAYYEEILKNRSERSYALFDVGYMLDRDHEKAQFKRLFGSETLLYSFGAAPHHYERIMFDEPVA
jgi:hypothetical protein